MAFVGCMQPKRVPGSGTELNSRHMAPTSSLLGVYTPAGLELTVIGLSLCSSVILPPLGSGQSFVRAGPRAPHSGENIDLS